MLLLKTEAKATFARAHVALASPVFNACAAAPSQKKRLRQYMRARAAARSAPVQENIYSVIYIMFYTFGARNIMTEESESQSTEGVTKLVIDRPTDFRFHAAYLAYSESWDKTNSEEVKMELNKIASSLSDGEISYSDFYNKLDQIRKPGSKRYAYPRRRIETQRKRDWRKKQTKNIRNARYR